MFLNPLRIRLNRISCSAIESSKINENYNEVPWKNGGKIHNRDSSKVTAKSSRISVSPLK
jgi:hypothetical protein